MNNKVIIFFFALLCLACDKENNDKPVDLTNIYDAFYNRGITIREMISEGLTVLEVFDGLVQGYGHVDYNLDNIVENGFSQSFINEGFSLSELLNSGISMRYLYFYGITIEQLINTNLTFKEIILGTIRVTSLDFVKMNFSAQKLIEEGIIEETPMSGFYILNYLHDRISYYPSENAHTLDIINNKIIGMTGWRLPTIDELIFIYENRGSLDLKVDIDELYYLDVHPTDLYDYRSYWISSTLENSCVSYLPYELNLNFRSGGIAAFCRSSYVAYLLPVIQL